eukprot:TRINITY_DN105210_c0_g1_i1.p1 TRINITY_DN105210_c0_g1~~TRINITY_DN105210_c0_g1_i1.p1  ORF type:complete len:501 (+),score=101.67 TRINITY_DN105210_c0_g1_i1:2457-3959(+)
MQIVIVLLLIIINTIMSERNLLIGTLLKQSYLDPSVQNLALLLYNHSPLKLSDLIKLTSDNPAYPAKLLEGLRILICEHLVFARKLAEEEEYLYYFDQDECIAWLYYPLFGYYIREHLGEVSWTIVSRFMLHKSLTAEKCMALVKADPLGQYSDEEIHEEFNKLAKTGYLKYDIPGLRLQKSEPAPAHPKAEKSLESKLKERKGQKAKEKAQRKAAKDMKAKKEVLEPIGKISDDQDQFFRLAHEKFVHHLRNIEIFKVIKEKLGEDPAVLVKIMLDNSEKIGPAYMNPISSSFSLEQLVELTKRPLGLNKASLQGLLNQLVKEQFKCIGKAESTLEYYVNSRLIVTELINACVGKIIEAKYSIGHARVYRILQAKGQLEEKQIFENCLLPQTTVRKIIETLYKEGIIQHTELLTKAGGAMHFYMIKENEVKDILVRLVQKAIANTLLKMESEDLVEQKEYEKEEKKEKLKGCVTEMAEQLMILQDYQADSFYFTLFIHS